MNRTRLSYADPHATCLTSKDVTLQWMVAVTKTGKVGTMHEMHEKKTINPKCDPRSSPLGVWLASPACARNAGAFPGVVCWVCWCFTFRITLRVGARDAKQIAGTPHMASVRHLGM